MITYSIYPPAVWQVALQEIEIHLTGLNPTATDDYLEFGCKQITKPKNDNVFQATFLPYFRNKNYQVFWCPPSICSDFGNNIDDSLSSLPFFHRINLGVTVSIVQVENPACR